MTRIRLNPQTQALRRAIEATSFAMARYEVWVNEYTQPNGRPGVEYIQGYGKDGHVVAHMEDDTGEWVLQWVGANELHAQATGLIEAHSSMFATI